MEPKKKMPPCKITWRHEKKEYAMRSTAVAVARLTANANKLNISEVVHEITRWEDGAYAITDTIRVDKG